MHITQSAACVMFQTFTKNGNSSLGKVLPNGILKYSSKLV